MANIRSCLQFHQASPWPEQYFLSKKGPVECTFLTNEAGTFISGDKQKNLLDGAVSIVTGYKLDD
jgi:hypothetical protein